MLRLVKHSICGFAFLAAVAETPASVVHPLDPLEDFEIVGAAQILLDGHAAAPGAIFQSVELRDPPKADVINFHTGNPIPREARVFFRQNKRSYWSLVNLVTGTFTPPVEIPKSDGQIGLSIQELLDFSFLFTNPDFLTALAKRGIDTPAKLARVLVTPLTAGSFGLPEESHRIVKAQMYFTAGATINLYAKPIEGLQAIVDLDDRSLLKLIDTGVVPVPTLTHEFDEATVAAQYGLRPPMKPIRITQPAGANFTVNGNFIEWQKWRFHVRCELRSGTVLSLVTYDGRQIMYRGALSEIFVPYQDPDKNWYYRTYMDAGEFGFGLLATPLKRGLDVPENTTLINALLSAALPDPTVPVVPLPIQDVIGVFERPTGNPEWRHFELFSPGGPAYEGRAEVELVVRMIAQVGNYDYVIDWIFTQRGAIRVEVAPTGIDVAKSVLSKKLSDPTANADTEHGTIVAPNLVAIYHSHHFNFRLDLDIDGPRNSFSLGRLKKVKTHGSARESVWVLDESTLAREKNAMLDHEGEFLWRVYNPSKKNIYGYNTSYLLESHASVEPLLSDEDTSRAGFIEHPLWVTAYDRDERFAAGDTPNQNPDHPGLPQYVKDNEDITNTDIVLWHTVGFHHVPSAEDYPVLPRESLSFELKPANFFDRNPALDLRRAPFEVTP